MTSLPNRTLRRTSRLRKGSGRLLTSSVALAAILLAAPGCRRERDAIPLPGSVPPRATIDSLRALGRYDEALSAARTRLAAISKASVLPRWILEDARREVATLERIGVAPDSVRDALGRADASTAASEALVERALPLAAADTLEFQLATRRRLLGGHHPEVASSLRALAAVALGQGQIRRAHDLDLEALEIRKRALGMRHPLVAESFDALGLDLKSAGDQREEAMRLYRQALDIRRELLGADSPAVMSSLMNIANLYRLGQQPDSALAIFRVVLEHRRRASGTEHDGVGDVLFSMAMTLTPRGAWSEAEPLLREAVAAERTLGPSGRVSLGRSLGAHGLVLRHLGRPAEAESALVESAALFEDLRRGASPGMSRAAQFPLVSYATLASAQLELGRERDAWFSLERSLARNLLDELTARGAVDTVGWWRGALERVQRALPEDAALVGWLTQRPGAAAEEYPFWCYAIRHEGPVHWRKVERPEGSGSRPADLALDDMRQELRAASSWPLRLTDAAALASLGRGAYELRIAPLERWLRGASRLVVVSPDFLHGTPVEAMVDSNGRTLSERFTILYAPSALLYAATEPRRVGSDARRPWSALLVGDGAPERGAGAEPRLAAAEAEVREIASLATRPTMLLGADASKERLQALAVSGEISGFRLIHFATHSAGDHIWLGRSALVLAAPRGGAGAANADSGARDERVDVDEILGTWRLDADLVTLAACQSITGPAASTEGYLGLHHAFLGAGARNVVVSLWPVDDEATSRLMVRFYRNLLHPDPSATAGDGTFATAEALAEARRWLSQWRAPDGTRPYAHPVYWAGFVLVSGGHSAHRPPA